jgi:hypothetical protein
LLCPSAATAQGAGAAAGVRGFADIGTMTFSASDSFESVLGSRSGTLFGGGAEVVLAGRVFAGFRLSRFQKAGERVFVFEGETFELGIPTTVRISPVEVTGGYRFGAVGSLVPYFGGGVGWHRYSEASDFAEDDENVAETFTGFHLLGGAEFRVARWIGVGGEAQWTTVPDALGENPTGVSTDFGETNLGGVAFRLKVTIGR